MDKTPIYMHELSWKDVLADLSVEEQSLFEKLPRDLKGRVIEQVKDSIAPSTIKDIHEMILGSVVLDLDSQKLFESIVNEEVYMPAIKNEEVSFPEYRGVILAYNLEHDMAMVELDDGKTRTVPLSHIVFERKEREGRDDEVTELMSYGFVDLFTAILHKGMILELASKGSEMDQDEIRKSATQISLRNLEVLDTMVKEALTQLEGKEHAR